MCEKVDILLRYGATLDDVRAHSHVLKNRHRWRPSRLEHASSVVCVPRRCLLRGSLNPNTSTRKSSTITQRRKTSKPINLVIYRNNLASPTRRTTLICGVKYHTSVGKQFRILRPKLEFLRSKGFTHDDIVMAPYIFKLGLESMRGDLR